MALIEVQSQQADVPSAWVEIDHVTNVDLTNARAALTALIAAEPQVSDAVAKAFIAVTRGMPALTAPKGGDAIVTEPNP